jgi:LPXTG-site transpeptidase (sortase) family protein
MTTMKQLKIIIVVLIFAFFGIWGGIFYLGEVQGQFSNTNLSIVASPTPIPTPTYIPSAPLSVSIPKINLSAVIEPVGLDKDGKMDVPTKDEDVAWYSLGYKPGEKGSAVLAGHLDTQSGAPAVFWNLDKLENGDEIFVTDEKNKTIKFVVYNKQKFIYNQVPLDEIFASQGEATLNLITCGGSFNQAARNYTHRTIVFTKQASF